MDHDELLRRLDAHMERGTRIMARSDMTMRRANEIMLRNEIAFRDLRDFLADERLAMKGLTREIMDATKRANERHAEMRADHKDFAAEMRAQRQALFRMLDRLDGKGGEPGVAGA